jgi:hypothetical protein
MAANRLLSRAVFAASLAISSLSSGAVIAQREDAPDPRPPNIEDILLSAAGFVRETAETQASAVIADEVYEQEVRSRPFGVNSQRPIRRTIRSEALFIWLAVERQWVFVRNVLSVDGRSVADNGARLDQLLGESNLDISSRVRRLQQESSRFNIGPVARTIGDPTFALRFLDRESQSRFTFKLGDIEQVEGVRAIKLAFDERARPTIVQANGRNAPTSGTMWVEPMMGTVVRTYMKLTTSLRTDESVTTEFQKDMNLQAWVPVRMSERYEERTAQTIICSASYMNYRRFGATVRVSSP